MTCHELNQKLKQEAFAMELQGKFTELEAKLSILSNINNFDSISLYIQKHPSFLDHILDGLAHDAPSISHLTHYSITNNPAAVHSILSPILNTYHPKVYSALKVGCFMRIEDLSLTSYYSGVYSSHAFEDGETYLASVINKCTQYFPYATEMDANIEQYIALQNRILDERLKTRLFEDILTLQQDRVFLFLQNNLEIELNISNFHSIHSYNQRNSSFISKALSNVIDQKNYETHFYSSVLYYMGSATPMEHEMNVYYNTMLSIYHPKIYTLSKAACFTQLEIEPSYGTQPAQPVLLDYIDSEKVAKCREFFPYPSELDASINMYVLQMTPESEHNHDEVNAVLAELLQTAS